MHHVIPINVLENYPELQNLLFWAKKNGKKFEFNGLDNGIPLQKKNVNFDMSGHTSHPQYDKAITDRIKNVIDNPIFDETDKFNEVQKIVNKAKLKLENEVLLGTKDVNQILNF